MLAAIERFPSVALVIPGEEAGVASVVVGGASDSVTTMPGVAEPVTALMGTAELLAIAVGDSVLVIAVTAVGVVTTEAGEAEEGVVSGILVDTVVFEDCGSNAFVPVVAAEVTISSVALRLS